MCFELIMVFHKQDLGTEQFSDVFDMSLDALCLLAFNIVQYINIFIVFCLLKCGSFPNRPVMSCMSCHHVHAVSDPRIPSIDAGHELQHTCADQPMVSARDAPWTSKSLQLVPLAAAFSA